MRFEVFLGSVRKFCTEHRECVPDAKTLKEMQAEGYTVYVDGKKVGRKKACDDESGR